jgi:hypothetical protein
VVPPGGENKKEKMGETNRVIDCEWEFIGEGYDPSQGGELCADEGDQSTEERGKPKKDEPWEYWYG